MDASRGDFDPDRSTAVPRRCRGVFTEEPRWLDLRWAREKTQLDLRHSRLPATPSNSQAGHEVAPEWRGWPSTWHKLPKQALDI